MTGPLPPGAYPPGRRLSTGTGRQVAVGELLAEGGRGYVYEVAGDPSLVLKQIKPEALAESPDIERRLKAMIAGRPASWRERASGHVLLAWPLDTVLADSRFAGFTMPRIDSAQTSELHHLANPSDRRDPAPETPRWVGGFTWDYLLRTATNLALATEILHQVGYVVGDFNERNILVTSQALVTLVDCDSMQVPDPEGGHFLCDVGRPEFTAPELLKRNDNSLARGPASDLFPLAVHVHQLILQGAHPFDGVWHGQGEKPKRPPLAIDGLYVYAGDRRLTPPPLTIGLELVPPALRDLFRRAFVTGARDPGIRPRGAEWCEALKATGDGLRTCKRVRAHVYPGHHKRCPWCEHDALVGAWTQAPLPAPGPVAPRPVAPRAKPAPLRPVSPAARSRATTPARPARPAPQRSGRSRWLAGLAGLAVAAVVGILVAGGSSPSSSEPSLVEDDFVTSPTPSQRREARRANRARQAKRARRARRAESPPARRATTPPPAPTRRSTPPDDGASGGSGSAPQGTSPETPTAGTQDTAPPDGGDLTGDAQPAPVGGGGGGGGGLSGSPGGGGGLSGTAGGGDGLSGTAGP